jgi:hypothetical protein
MCLSRSGNQKHIRYLKATKDKGLIMSPDKRLKLDCYVDSDYGGLFAAEDGQDPMCARSRTGYVLLFSGVPILWVSKMQTQIALSTMKAEYIAISQSMHNLIPILEILKEVKAHVFGEESFSQKCSSKSKAFKDANGEEEIPQSTVFEDNAACLKMARMPKLTPRTKHIAIPLHWYRSKVLDLSIEIQAVGQISNGLTNIQKVCVLTSLSRIERQSKGGDYYMPTSSLCHVRIIVSTTHFRLRGRVTETQCYWPILKRKAFF